MASHGLINGLVLPDVNENNGHENHSPSSQSLLSARSQLSHAQTMLFLQQQSRLGAHGGNERTTYENTTGMDHGNNDNETTPIVTTPTDSDIVSVINICNDIDTEGVCLATDTLVKRCIKQVIWSSNKFLTDHTIKNMCITDRDNPNTIINVLINFTRKTNLSNAHRFRFWKKYSTIVQKELNTLKTVCTRQIKDKLMAGKY